MAYDPPPFAKQKRLAHLLKPCGETEWSKTRAVLLWGKIRTELDRLLSGTYTDPDNSRLAKRQRKQRKHLMRFSTTTGSTRRTTWPSARSARR